MIAAEEVSSRKSVPSCTPAVRTGLAGHVPTHPGGSPSGPLPLVWKSARGTKSPGPT